MENKEDMSVSVKRFIIEKHNTSSSDLPILVRAEHTGQSLREFIEHLANKEGKKVIYKDDE